MDEENLRARSAQRTQWMECAQRGDREAYGALLMDVASPLLRFLRRSTPSCMPWRTSCLSLTFTKANTGVRIRCTPRRVVLPRRRGATLRGRLGGCRVVLRDGR